MLAYVDSSIWITHVEGLQKYKDIIEIALSTLSKEWVFCYSKAVELEILAKPIREDKPNIVQSYRNIFKGMKLLKTYIKVFEDALSISSIESLKGIDTIHVAIAKHYKCKLFVSTDPHFKNLTAINPFIIELNEPAG